MKRQPSPIMKMRCTGLLQEIGLFQGALQVFEEAGVEHEKLLHPWVRGHSTARSFGLR